MDLTCHTSSGTLGGRLYSEGASMSLALLVRAGDTIYYAADSRCLFTKQDCDGVERVERTDNEYKKIFRMPGSNIVLTVTGDAEKDGLSAETIIQSSNNLNECRNGLKRLDVAVMYVSKMNDAYYVSYLLDDSYECLQEYIIYATGHKITENIIPKFKMPSGIGEKDIITYINRLTNLFIVYHELADNSIGGHISIFKQKYGEPPVRIQGFYDI